MATTSTLAEREQNLRRPTRLVCSSVRVTIPIIPNTHLWNAPPVSQSASTTGVVRLSNFCPTDSDSTAAILDSRESEDEEEGGDGEGKGGLGAFFIHDR
jgi:hypothetical protein